MPQRRLADADGTRRVHLVAVIHLPDSQRNVVTLELTFDLDADSPHDPERQRQIADWCQRWARAMV